MSEFSQNNQNAINLIHTARCMVAVPMFDLSVEPNDSEKIMLHICLLNVEQCQKNSRANGIALHCESNIFKYLYGDDYKTGDNLQISIYG